MNTNQGDEKIDLRPLEQDEEYSFLFGLSDDEYNRVCNAITAQADAYMRNRFDRIDDRWFDCDFTESDHRLLGIALRFVDMNRTWANISNKYRNNEFNRFMIMSNNTFSAQLSLQVLRLRRGDVTSVSDLLALRNVQMLSRVIMKTLEKLFDTDHADSTFNDIEVPLSDPCRNTLESSMAHACFTYADNVPNICWLEGSEYDVHIAHYLRAVLFHFLSIVQHILGHQPYRVHENLIMVNASSPECNTPYREVELIFSLELHLPSHLNEGSDDDVKREHVVENVWNDGESDVDDQDRDPEPEVSVEEEPEPEVSSDEEEHTFSVILGADGTTTTYRPEAFTRITQTMESGRVQTEEEQMEKLAKLFVPLLDIEHLERLQYSVTAQIQHLRSQQPAAVVPVVIPAVVRRPFRFNTTFSSGSEGEEETPAEVNRNFFSATSFSSGSEGEEER